MGRRTVTAIAILLFIICAPAMADKTTKILTAFKENVTPGENADLSVDFVLLDSSSVSIDEDREVNIPQEFRQIAYNVFTWNLHGNAYRGVTLAFEFYPMVNNNVKDSELQKTSSIRYRINISHQSTRIGNTAISSYDRTLSASEKDNLTSGQAIEYTYYTNNIPTTYDMYYADYYHFSNQELTVNNTSATITLAYNFATNSVAVGFPAEAKVCNFWNRYGSASVTLLDIDETAANYATGNYEAPVRLTISTDD